MDLGLQDHAVYQTWHFFCVLGSEFGSPWLEESAVPTEPPYSPFL